MYIEGIIYFTQFATFVVSSSNPVLFITIRERETDYCYTTGGLKVQCKTDREGPHLQGYSGDSELGNVLILLY